MQDDFIPAVKKGRVVVTNVRGLDDTDRITAILGDLSETFKLTHVDTTVEEGRERLRRFHHWAPFGAFFLIDEINTIFPSTWRDNQLKEYAYPGGLDQAKEDGRPCGVIEALEMHRHYNWDFVVTTPSYKKVHSIFSDIAEVAYRHENRKVIGLGGSYWEIMHLADNTGKASSDLARLQWTRR